MYIYLYICNFLYKFIVWRRYNKSFISALTKIPKLRSYLKKYNLVYLQK